MDEEEPTLPHIDNFTFKGVKPMLNRLEPAPDVERTGGLLMHVNDTLGTQITRVEAATRVINVVADMMFGPGPEGDKKNPMPAMAGGNTRDLLSQLGAAMDRMEEALRRLDS